MSGSLGDLVIRIVGDNAQFDSSVDKSESKLDSFGKKASQIGGNLTKWVSLPLIGIGVAAVKSAADLEMTEASFTTMLGSAEKAKDMLGQLKDFAAKTPFSLTDLSDASKTLLQFGISADQVMPTIKALGDVSGGNAQRFQMLSLAFGQMSASGRLMGQDLLQMINAGFNPLQEISKTTGESVSVLKKKMEEGGISAQMVADSFKRASSEGGQFFGGMERGSQTLSGQISTLLDDTAELGRQFAGVLLPTIKDVVKGLSGFVQGFGQLDDGTKKLIVTTGLVVAAIGPVVSIVGNVTKAMVVLNSVMAANPILAVVGAVALLTGGFIALTEAMHSANVEKLNKQYGDLAESVGISAESADKAVIAFQRFEQTGGFEGMDQTVKDISTSLGISYDKTADLLVGSGKISKEYVDQLKNLKAQYVEQNAINALITDDEYKAKQNAASLARANAILDQRKQEEAAIAEEKKKQDEIATGERKSLRETIADLSIRVNGETELQAIERERQKVLAEARENYVKTGDEIDKINALYDELLAKKQEEIAIEQAKIEGEQAATDARRTQTEERARQRTGEFQLDKKTVADIDKEREDAHQKELARIQEESTAVISGASQVLSAVQGLVQAQSKAKLEALDREMEATLEANGLAEESTLDRLNRELEEAKRTGDTKKQDELQREIEREKIKKDFEKRRAQIEYDSAMQSWNLNLAMAVAEAARAVISGLLTQPFIPAGLAAGALAGVIGGIQIAAVNASKPQPPALAEGGIVMPNIGGTLARVAEAGQPEVIFPLDKLDQFLRQPTYEQNNDIPMMITVHIGPEQLYSQLHTATKNRQLLIDTRAVV